MVEVDVVTDVLIASVDSGTGTEAEDDGFIGEMDCGDSEAKILASNASSCSRLWDKAARRSTTSCGKSVKPLLISLTSASRAPSAEANGPGEEVFTETISRRTCLC